MRITEMSGGLAVAIPQDVADALGLKAGDEVEVKAVSGNRAEIEQRAREEALVSMREFRGRIPADFKFDRDEANAR